MTRLFQKGDIQPVIQRCQEYSLQQHCRLTASVWYRLQVQLHRQGATWLAIHATGAWDRGSGSYTQDRWLVFSDVRCPAGAPWREIGPVELAHLLTVWLHLRFPEEIEYSQNLRHDFSHV